MSKLHQYCLAWLKWACTALQNEDGWESNFYQWNNLMAEAKETMSNSFYSSNAMLDLELCWKISNETEDLADYAKSNLDQCRDILFKLASSEYPEVRWQVYEVLGYAGKTAEEQLRKALSDTDSYCKRRAILSLSKLCPHDALQLSERFANDTDPYIRKAALELRNCKKD